MDHWGDDSHVEGLSSDLRTIDDVVVELLTAARLATGLIPSLAGRVCWERATVWVLLLLLRCFIMTLVSVNECLQVNAHVFGKLCATGVIFHHSTTSVMLTMPNDLIRSRFVQAEPERRLVLPHFSCDIVTAAKLIGKALAIFVQHEATHATQGFCCQEFDLSISIIWLDKARGMNLDPFEVNGLGTDGFSHLDGITRAVFTIGGRQV
mmetsp:Transcript_115503/g.188224  ORF Transcript_115503/g.188224 Transcript_115503/m.188224 type:complete len:208 (-) Transcript_115503:413-1036(-)